MRFRFFAEFGVVKKDDMILSFRCPVGDGAQWMCFEGQVVSCCTNNFFLGIESVEAWRAPA